MQYMCVFAFMISTKFFHLFQDPYLSISSHPFRGGNLQLDQPHRRLVSAQPRRVRTCIGQGVETTMEIIEITGKSCPATISHCQIVIVSVHIDACLSPSLSLSLSLSISLSSLCLSRLPGYRNAKRGAESPTKL